MSVSEPMFEMVVKLGWFKRQTIMFYRSEKNVAYALLKALDAHFLNNVSAKEVKIKRFGIATLSQIPIPELYSETEPSEVSEQVAETPSPTSPSSQTCRDCGAELTEDANFCPECGASVSKPTEAEESKDGRHPTIVSVTYDQDLAVYDYIVQHGATISQKLAAEELGITVEDFKNSVERLKKSGKLAQS